MVEDTVSGSATYVAQWSQAEYTVTYQPGEHGTFAEASTSGLHYGDTTPKGPDAPENHETGWSFTGWEPTVEGTVSGNAVYALQWSATSTPWNICREGMEPSSGREHQGLHYGDATPEGPDAVNNHEAGWSFCRLESIMGSICHRKCSIYRDLEPE